MGFPFYAGRQEAGNGFRGVPRRFPSRSPSEGRWLPKLPCRRGDPIEARAAIVAKAKLEAAHTKTFRQCAEAYINDQKAGWRNPKHHAQWFTSLETYVYPIIGDLSAQAIDVQWVLKVLEQKKDTFNDQKFWMSRPETANRVRNRMEAILDWAAAREYRRGGNPARWRGLLQNLLPRHSKIKGVKHHTALPYGEVGDFVQSLRKQEGIGVGAFEFMILTAARTNEALRVQWKELDFEKKIWTIPAGKIKAGKTHRVPLSERALALLLAMGNAEMVSSKPDAYVFSFRQDGKPMSKMAFLSLLKRMKYKDRATVHGFRSTFRDWCGEQTSFSREIAEAALAHVNGDKTERAYWRGDVIDKRRQLMNAWAVYCSTPSVKKVEGNNVVPFAA